MMIKQKSRSPLGRVLVFTPWYPSPDEPWQGTFIKDQLTALRALGVDARVLKLTWGRPFVRIREVDAGDGRLLGAEERFLNAAHLAFLLRRSRPCDASCDVVLAHEVWVSTALRHLSLPSVGILHGPDPMTSSGARTDPLRKAIIRRALRRVDRLVAVGMPVHSDLPAQLRDKTAVIENGVPLEAFPRRRLSAVARMSAPDFPHFITVGNVNANKNQELLLRNFYHMRRRWPRAMWTVIGDGPERIHLEELRNQLGLQGAVRFTGRLSPRDVAARLAEADLFVLPSLKEAFGCVYLEAMAVGVPTLVSRSAGMSYLIDDHRYVHDPRDFAEIVAKADAILSSAEAYENAVGYGRKLAERCTWRANAERLHEVLESVVRPRSEAFHG